MSKGNMNGKDEDLFLFGEREREWGRVMFKMEEKRPGDLCHNLIASVSSSF